MLVVVVFFSDNRRKPQSPENGVYAGNGFQNGGFQDGGFQPQTINTYTPTGIRNHNFMVNVEYAS